MTKQTLVIRADANVRMGTGHVMRCLALGQAWQDLGGDVHFVVADLAPTLVDRVRLEKMRLTFLADHVEIGSYADAKATMGVCQQDEVQWIVVDGYQFGAEYQQQLKATGLSLLWIDDYAHASHYYADVVLNQNIYATVDMYEMREPYTQLLIGAKYTLLRREFRAWLTKKIGQPNRPPKILVTMGGADVNNMTLHVVHALKMLSMPLEIIVLVGGQNSHFKAIATAVADDKRFQIQQNVTDMPSLMSDIDMAISAGGSTNWELCFMGVPTLIISLAENQKPISIHLHNSGLAVGLGWYEEITLEGIQQSFIQLLNDVAKRDEIAQKAQHLFDGCGANRVAKIFSAPQLALRLAQLDDAQLVWVWANDPHVRAMSFHTAEISWESHLHWFTQKLDDPKTTFYIALDNASQPIGQVRYERQGVDAVISISLAPSSRGQGYGAQLLRQANLLYLATCPNLAGIVALIKEGNEASLKAFMKAGFKEIESICVREIIARQFYLSREKGMTLPC